MNGVRNGDGNIGAAALWRARLPANSSEIPRPGEKSKISEYITKTYEVGKWKRASGGGTSVPAATTSIATPTSVAESFQNTGSVELSGGQWQCDTCTLINESNAARCSVCTAAKPTRTVQQKPPTPAAVAATTTAPAPVQKTIQTPAHAAAQTSLFSRQPPPNQQVPQQQQHQQQQPQVDLFKSQPPAQAQPQVDLFAQPPPQQQQQQQQQPQQPKQSSPLVCFLLL